MKFVKLYHKTSKDSGKLNFHLWSKKIKHEYVNQLNLIEIYPPLKQKCVIRSYTNPN